MKQLKRITAIFLILAFQGDFVAHFVGAQRNAWVQWMLMYRAGAVATAFVDGTLGSNCGGNYSIASQNCTGSDGNAFPTIAAGVAAMSASDTLYVRTGTYAEVVGSAPSGVSGLPTIVAGCPATVCATQETPLLQSAGPSEGIIAVSRTYQTFRNFKISFCSYAPSAGTGISVQSSTNIVAEDIEIDGCAASAPSGGFGTGVYTYHSPSSTHTNVVLRRLYIHDIGGSLISGEREHGIYIDSRGVTVEHSRLENICNYSIHAYYGSGNTNDTTIRYNRIVNDGVVASHPDCSSQGGAAILAYGSNNIIANNAIITPRDRSIELGPGSGGFVYNNSAYGSQLLSGYGIDVSGGHSGAYVRNNALLNAGTINVAGSATSSNNRCNSISTHCHNTLTPGFTSTTNLTLTASSGLVDAGVFAIGTMPGGAPVTALGNGPLPDIGCCESIPFASASATNTSTVDIQFGTAYAPISTVSTCTGFTLRQAAATKTLATCTNPVGTNGLVRLTCAACLSGGGGTIDFSVTAGKFTDSIAIGGTLNQANFALPVTTVANNITGTTEVFTSRHFRQRTFARAVTDTIGAAWIKGEDAAGTVRVDGGQFSIWFLIDCTVANCPSVGFQFEANLNGGAYANVTDSCVTNPACFSSTNSAAPHGTVIPSVQLTDSLGNYLAGAVAAQATSYPVLDLAINQSTQIQVNGAIKSGLVAGTDVICIRPKLDSGAAVTHAQTACLNVVNPAGSPA